MEEKRLMSVRKYAKFVGISHQEVYNRIKAGEIVPQKEENGLYNYQSIDAIKYPRQQKLIAGRKNTKAS